MNTEDILKLACDAPLQEVLYPTTVAGLLRARSHISGLGLPADSLVLSETIRQRFCADENFVMAFDPSPDVEDVKLGKFGSIYGMDLFVDLEGKLEPGTIVVVSTTGLSAIKRPYSEDRYVFKCRLV